MGGESRVAGLLVHSFQFFRCDPQYDWFLVPICGVSSLKASFGIAHGLPRTGSIAHSRHHNLASPEQPALSRRTLGALLAMLVLKMTWNGRLRP
jgi:hypothetical protein